MSEREYVVDFGDGRSSAFVRLAMAEAESHGANLREEIVRCRDCAKCDESAVCGKMTLFCHHFSMFDSAGFPVEPDGFCAWGERKVCDE